MPAADPRSTNPEVPAGVRFTQLATGSTVAWTSMGEGPPLVMVPGWLCHVQELWTHPAAASARAKFAANHQFIWYDRLGCGLSDRQGFTASLENDVDQLIAVLDAANVERADFIGYSFGGPPAAVFAARYPERVNHLVLYSSYARGSRLSTEDSHELLKALIRANWTLGSRTLASLFLPNGSGQDIKWFTRFQELAARAEMAASLLDYMRTQDIREALPRISAPTLVLANSEDTAVRPANTRELAAGIPGATLHILDGNEHDPFIRDSGSVVETILDFIAERPITKPNVEARAVDALTPRECEVLRLIAAGETNKAIAANLGIQVSTVERHVSNTYEKLGAKGRADAAMHAVALKLAPVR